MKSAFTAGQIQAAERPLLDAGVPLMARASYALYQQVSRVVQLRRAERTGRAALSGASVVFLVGQGNNGGDALFAAALLAARPVSVTVVLTSGKAHHEGLAAVRRTQARMVEYSREISDELVSLVGRADVVVDGILGIGAVGAPRGGAGQLVRALKLNRPFTSLTGRPAVVAVDVPSGVDSSTGAVADPRTVIAADLTVTFGARKVGLVTMPGAQHVGRIECVDIGLDLPAPAIRSLEAQDFVDDPDLADLVSTPAFDAHKYTRGVVGVCAGTLAFPGAGLLATGAASVSGVGMVRYLGEKLIAQDIIPKMPQVVSAGGRVQSWVVGSGMGESDLIRMIALEIINRPEAAVVDAGAISMLRSQDALTLSPRHVLTPHAGELAQVLQHLGERFTRETVERDPLTAARTLHKLTGATVVAKGPLTVIAGSDGVYVHSGSTSRLATAGSGDVLAGIIAAALARAVGQAESAGTLHNIPWAKLAAAGVAIHAGAGNLAAGKYGAAVMDAGTSATPLVLGGLSLAGATKPIVAADIVDSIPNTHRLLSLGEPVF